ncbi:unnamed protein product [Penicillium egyptiacum]|uniref:Uncharacterized protein n=1 Tax=Penicillium egyptiacum TaxID=1303716 RepID=A0A9W4KJE3_9EURO|nr:unnamed protein product [Penicillium egyptiacum]
MAFVNSRLLNATSDWDAIMKDAKTVRLRFPKWVFKHYVYEKYGEAFAPLHILSLVLSLRIPTSPQDISLYPGQLKTSIRISEKERKLSSRWMETGLKVSATD